MPPKFISQIRQEAGSLVAAIWIGLILGVSFYAAPIKFTAEGVEFEQLLRVGQVTFQNFTWIECGAFVLLLAVSRRGWRRAAVINLTILCLTLLIQKFAILPILDADLVETLAGHPAGGKLLHFVYGGLDLLKILLLMGLFIQLRIPLVNDQA